MTCPEQTAASERETVVARATGHGPSARAIIRVSGPGAAPLRDALTRHAGRRLSPGWLEVSHGVCCPVLCAFFAGPRSYTGEDVLEITLPGNPALVDRAVESLCAPKGFRRAHPGEFSARAFMSGRLSLSQAEGIAAGIAAQTDAQWLAAQRVRAGITGATHSRWANEATSLLALVEAGIDFTDQEDVLPIAPVDLVARLDALIEQINAALGSPRESAASRALPVVALVGRPNAGKSTLFNALVGRRRSVESHTPGTTRDVIEETISLSDYAPGAGSIILQDLAGLDDALAHQSALDSAGQCAARAAICSADVLVWCDPAGAFDPADLPPTNPGTTIIRVRTFGDLPSSAAGDDPSIPLCALDGWNLGVLKRALVDAAVTPASAGSADLLPRHGRAAAEALAALRDARDTVAPSQCRLDHVELVADSLRRAVDHLGELTGKISPDDVIGRIFATFCVGK